MAWLSSRDGRFPLSAEVEYAPDTVQLREMCHDMRQPIASILALAAAALTEPGLAVTARGRLEQIVGQAEWLADMIDGSLAGPGQEDPGETDQPDHAHADVVRIVSEVIAAECLTWSGEVTLTSPSGPVWRALHPVLLRRVVANLLGNATRAAEPAGAVTVEIRRDKGGVMLAVEDNGPGFGQVPSGTGLDCPPWPETSSNMAEGWNVAAERTAARVSACGYLKSNVGRRSGADALVLCDDNRILCEALRVALEARSSGAGHRDHHRARDSRGGEAPARRVPGSCRSRGPDDVASPGRLHHEITMVRTTYEGIRPGGKPDKITQRHRHIAGPEPSSGGAGAADGDTAHLTSALPGKVGGEWGKGGAGAVGKLDDS
jgi:Histidine kinase-, DNA gyrase B-, and HSP90-like ATPase